MEKISVLADNDLHFWERLVLNKLSLSFSTKVYWWVVDLHNPLFSLCDEETFINDIKNGAFIVVDHSQDPGFYKTLIKLYMSDLLSVFSKHKLDMKKIIIVSPAPVDIFYGNHPRYFNYISFNSLFEITKTAIDFLQIPIVDLHKEPLKHFLLLMRRDSQTRRLTNYFVNKKDIRDKCNLSHLRITEGRKLTSDDLKAEILQFSDNSDFSSEDYLTYGLQKVRFDDPYLFKQKGNATHTYDLHNQYLSKVLFEVVSETDASECLFITEKTYKPLLLKSPFILLGNRFTLKFLRDLGFKTFDKVIDESYDEERSTYLRVSKALNEARKLCDKPLSECYSNLRALDDICSFNKDHFLNTTWDFGLEDKMKKIICNK